MHCVLLFCPFPPPRGKAVEQSQPSLHRLVLGHLVLELASLLRKGADSFMNPLVAVHLVLPCRLGAGRHDAIDLVLWSDGSVTSSRLQTVGIPGDCLAVAMTAFSTLLGYDMQDTAAVSYLGQSIIVASLYGLDMCLLKRRQNHHSAMLLLSRRHTSH